MPKNAEKFKFLMGFVEIFNTLRFERNCRETALEKIDKNRYFYGKKLKTTFF